MEENVVDLLLNHITTKMDVVAVMVVPLIITIIMSMINNINMSIIATSIVAQTRQKRCPNLRNVVVLMVVPLIIITININMNNITMTNTINMNIIIMTNSINVNIMDIVNMINIIRSVPHKHVPQHVHPALQIQVLVELLTIVTP